MTTPPALVQDSYPALRATNSLSLRERVPRQRRVRVYLEIRALIRPFFEAAPYRASLRACRLLPEGEGLFQNRSEFFEAHVKAGLDCGDRRTLDFGDLFEFEIVEHFQDHNFAL